MSSDRVDAGTLLFSINCPGVELNPVSHFTGVFSLLCPHHSE